MAFIVALFFLVFSIVVAILGYSVYLKKQSKSTAIVLAPFSRKYTSVDLHKYRTLFFLNALIFSLSFAILVIEYPTYEKQIQEFGASEVVLEDEIFDIPITEMPPPPPPQKIKSPEIIEVPDEDIIEEPEIEIEPEEDPPVEDIVENIIDEVVVEEEEINTVLDITEVQQKPSFPGGMGALYKYIQTNFRWPPRDLAEGNGGRVFVQFVVGKDGKVTDVKVVRGINERLDAEAVRVVESLPRWNPGRNAGTPVPVRYSMPVMLKTN